MEHAIGWLVTGVFLGMGIILALMAALDEAKLALPADEVLPLQFRQAWRT